LGIRAKRELILQKLQAIHPWKTSINIGCCLRATSWLPLVMLGEDAPLAREAATGICSFIASPRASIFQPDHKIWDISLYCWLAAYASAVKTAKYFHGSSGCFVSSHLWWSAEQSVFTHMTLSQLCHCCC